MMDRSITTDLGARDRPAGNPSWVDCKKCGYIFFGAEWHQFCAVCVKEVSSELRAVQLGVKL